MPRDIKFDEDMRHKVLDFSVHDIALITGEGVPRVEIICSHLAAPKKKKITLYPAAESLTVTTVNQGRRFINTTISPSIFTIIDDLEDSDVKKE